jgi:hypothetical protein
MALQRREGLIYKKILIKHLITYFQTLKKSLNIILLSLELNDDL